MISKQDILERANVWGLRPEMVEKDYVLGWLLAAISLNPMMKDLWVFKGGTSIKKCYFGTYRFSEDLDFSLLPKAPYTEKDLRQIIIKMVEKVLDLSGIRIAQDLIRIDVRHDKLGLPTFRARIYYQGPLGQVRNLAGIIFDITNNESIINEPVRRSIIHPYPDALPETDGVLVYTPEELIAEKTRALFERTSPRDLYDVAYLLENEANLIMAGENRTGE